MYGADLPIGQPSFALYDDEVATVIDLLISACQAAQTDVTAGMLEVPLTIVVRKALRRVKKVMAITNIEVRGEVEIDNMAAADPSILGRIDLALKFARQFGDEDDYVGIECKRIGAGLHALNKSYVAKGVERFVNGQYATGHVRGFMLGYVIVGPVAKPLKSIRGHVVKAYGAGGKMKSLTTPAGSLALESNVLSQVGGQMIEIQHLLIDMTIAAPSPKD
jgi:hypothetical protein